MNDAQLSRLSQASVPSAYRAILKKLSDCARMDSWPSQKIWAFDLLMPGVRSWQPKASKIWLIGRMGSTIPPRGSGVVQPCICNHLEPVHTPLLLPLPERTQREF